jgi:Leucine-rich repeat (LRR) protein
VKNVLSDYRIIKIEDKNLARYYVENKVKLPIVPLTTNRAKKIKKLPKMVNIGAENFNSIEKFENIEELYISGENLKDNISFLKKLKKLKRLTIRNCNLRNIYDLYNLEELEELYLEDNDITNIDILMHLINLEVVRLNNNKIKDISSINFINNLKEINLKGNPVQSDVVLDEHKDKVIYEEEKKKGFDILNMEHVAELISQTFDEILLEF